MFSAEVLQRCDQHAVRCWVYDGSLRATFARCLQTIGLCAEVSSAALASNSCDPSLG